MELGQKLPDELRALAGFNPSSRGLHGAFEREELGEQMIQGEEGIVREPRFAEGIRIIVEGALQLTAQHQGSGQAHGPQGIKAIRILHNLRLMVFSSTPLQRL